MQSKNKSSMTVAERLHVGTIKSMACIICEAEGPSDCHELEQGLWYTSIPLCRDCHMGSLNGIHGQRRMWNVMKLNELAALNLTIRAVVAQNTRK